MWVRGSTKYEVPRFWTDNVQYRSSFSKWCQSNKNDVLWRAQDIYVEKYSAWCNRLVYPSHRDYYSKLKISSTIIRNINHELFMKESNWCIFVHPIINELGFFMFKLWSYIYHRIVDEKKHITNNEVNIRPLSIKWRHRSQYTLWSSVTRK